MSLPTPSKNETVSLPRAVFATRHECVEFLARVFPDLRADSVGANDDAFDFVMRTQSDRGCVHDPMLEAKLVDDWHLGIDDVFLWHRMQAGPGRIRLDTFNHSWALLGWSEWLSRTGGRGDPPIVIHVDSHDDLQAPALLCGDEPEVYSALVGEETMDLRAPATVRRYVERGLVGIGSFILPFLRAASGADFVHVVPRIFAGSTAADGFRAFTESPSLLNARTGIAEPGVCGYWYSSVCDFSEMQRYRGSRRPVLLDMDLDFFALLPSRTIAGEQPHVPAIESIDRTMCDFALALDASGLMQRVEVVTIAYSPGFCPAALWLPILERLEAALAPILTPY